MSLSRITLISLTALFTALLSGCEQFGTTGGSGGSGDYSGSGSFSGSGGSVVNHSSRLMKRQNPDRWLAISKEVDAMTPEQAVIALNNLGAPVRHDDLFYYGVLNQKLGRVDGWIQARDAFRKLENDPVVKPTIRELARILEAHNQSLINWHQRHQNLQKELAESVFDREALKHKRKLMKQKNKVLEQKIEALTDLEAVISDRKKQVSDEDLSSDSLKGGD